MEIKDKVLESLISPLRMTFEEEGLTPKFLARRLKSELNYKEPIEQLIIEGTGRNKKTKKVVRHVKSVAAFAIRQKARQDCHRLLGHYPPDKKEFAGPGGLPLGTDVETKPIRVVFVSPDDKESKE